MTSLLVTIVLIGLNFIGSSRKSHILILKTGKDVDMKAIEQIIKDNTSNHKIKSRNYTEKGINIVVEIVTKEVDVLCKLLDENKDIKKQYVHTLLSAEDYEKAYDNVKDLYEDGGEKDVQVLDLYGQYYITQNEEEKAKNYYSKIERINGKYKDYQVNAAQRFNQIGNYDAAETYAKEYVRHKPQDAAGYNMLGKISSNKGFDCG